ncbi:MAG: hypothetical protein ACOY40_12355 [Bacillota bacterium]
MVRKEDFRLVRMALSGWDTAILHNKNPWMPMWWSVALPGLGHLCQGNYVRGLMLMSWEILVNLKANLNLSIMYTFTGRFEKAGEVLDSGWALFYGVIFFFAVFDSYRTAVEVNMLARLERSQPRRYYKFMEMPTGGVNYLDKGNPWVAAAWSALLTGFGHIYNGKTFKALILLGWAVATIYFAHLNNAIIDTFNGRFQRAAENVDYQWLLFFPSVYFFAIWDAYTDCVEMNKLFAEAQKEYLREKYGR